MDNKHHTTLLALAAHIRHHAGDSFGDVRQLPYFLSSTPTVKQLEEAERPARLAAAYAGLVQTTTTSAECLIDLADTALNYGLRAMLVSLGNPTRTRKLALHEAGRLVVKNAFPRALGFYAAGPMDDFSVHRLPLSCYKPGLHIASAEILAQGQLADALRRVRSRNAGLTRQQVQANPMTAIRSQKTGRPLSKWDAGHWAQITWRLGYTTAFDILAAAGDAARDKGEAFTPPTPELRDALVCIVTYCLEVFSAYVAGPKLTAQSIGSEAAAA